MLRGNIGSDLEEETGMTHSHTHETDEEIAGWFAGRVPGDWFTGAPEVSIDRDEILVVGTLPDVGAGEGASAEAKAAAA